MSENLIFYEVKGRVAIITINRQDKANAVNSDMLKMMHGHLIEADENDKVRCIIIRSVGEKFFTAGYDLKEVMEDHTKIKMITEWGRKVNETIMFLKKPVITQIHGIAIGFGVLLTVASDLRVFADRPKDELYLKLPELYISAYPQTGATLMPIMAFGLSYAKTLLFTNRNVSLDELRNINFPTKIFPLETIEAETLKYAKEIAKLKPEFIFTYKAMTTIMNKAYIKSCLDMEDESGAYAIGPKKSMKDLHDFIQELYKKYP